MTRLYAAVKVVIRKFKKLRRLLQQERYINIVLRIGLTVCVFQLFNVGEVFQIGEVFFRLLGMHQ